jgi:hypothetical protein
MNQNNYLIQLAIGFILFGVLCWFASSYTNNNYDNPDIDAGYCNSRECW